MKLVVGQNISIEKIGVVEIDFAWRSLKSDLNLSIHAFAFDDGKVISEQEVDPKNLPLPDSINQDDSGRHFIVEFPKLSAKVDRIVFYGLLPEETRHSLKQMSAFTIKVNDKNLGRIASMDIEAFNDEHKSVLLCEFYKHNNNWKLAYKLQAFKTNQIETLSNLGLQIKEPQKVNSIETNSVAKELKTEQPAETINASAILENVDLKKGQNLSLGEHFQYCTAITCELNVVPKIDDLTINVIAINRENKVNNIKDFLYQENKSLRGDGVKISHRDVSINLEQIPDDITKIQILVTRPSCTKRISSADFIELALVNTYTGQKIAKYVSETTDKNYNTMVLINFYRGHKGWSIRAVGQGFSGGLKKVGERYHFSPPKLRYQAPNPSLSQNVNSVAIDNNGTVEKYKKQQSLSYWLMGIAALLTLLTFSKVLFLPLAGILGALAWYFYQSSSKALKSIEDEKFERLILTMIKANNYVLTPFDVATNCQINIQRATQILDDLCSKGLGHTSVNREGAIFYDFSSLKNTNY